MAAANPPIIVLRSTKFGSGGYKRALEDILFQLWTKSFGAAGLADGVGIAQSSLDYGDFEETFNLAAAFAALDSSEDDVGKFNAVTAQDDYAALSFDFVNAKSNSTVKFPSHPSENDIIVVRNGDGSRIKIDGNGRHINGASTVELVRKGTSIEFYYFISDNEWFAK